MRRSYRYGNAGQADLLADELRPCTIPIVGVLVGNHDYESGHSETIKDILHQAGVRILDGQSCEIEGVSFIGLKGLAADLVGACSATSVSLKSKPSLQKQLNEENALREATSKRMVVVLHYAPIAETAEGEPPELYPFLGCSRLAETIVVGLRRPSAN